MIGSQGYHCDMNVTCVHWEMLVEQGVLDQVSEQAYGIKLGMEVSKVDQSRDPGGGHWRWGVACKKLYDSKYQIQGRKNSRLYLVERLSQICIGKLPSSTPQQSV